MAKRKRIKPRRPQAATKRVPCLQVYRDAAGDYRLRLWARNGKILADTEGYVTARGGDRAARRLIEIMRGPLELCTSDRKVRRIKTAKTRKAG